MGTWFDDMNPRGTAQERGGAQISHGLDQIAAYTKSVQDKKEERAYSDKLLADQRSLNEKEQSRPVAEPVSSLLNELGTRMRNGKMAGKTAAVLWKLVQDGQITEEQAMARLDSLGEVGVAAPPPMATPGVTGLGGEGPPMPIRAPVTEGNPQMRQLASESAYHGALNPDAGRPVVAAPVAIGPAPAPVATAVPVAVAEPVLPPPMNPTVPVTAGGVQEMPSSVGVAPTEPGVPPPPAHRWTVRDVGDLNAAGGYPKDREKSEAEILMQIIQEQGRNKRTDTVVDSRESLGAAKLQQEQAKLHTYVQRWDADRRQQWAIAMANLNNKTFMLGGRYEAQRDTALLRDARAAITNLQNNDSKLRTSIGTLAKNPTVMAKIQENEAQLLQAEARLTEMENMVRARAGEKPAGTGGPSLGTVAPPSETSMQGSTTPTYGPGNPAPAAPGSPVPDPTPDFVKRLRGGR